MTLEDFFTLTEIKDGLTAPSRVEELVSVMQRDKDCVVKNVGDATRQWASVASTIAATRNKDCLDVFMQLDGLQYIDRWLQDVQQLNNDSTDGSIKESIVALLRALENLHVDRQRSISSGIWSTVENLTAHSSSQVQDIAKALFDSWKQDKLNDPVHHEINNSSSSHDNKIGVKTVLTGESSKPEFSAADVPLSKPSGSDEKICTAEAHEAESLPLKNSKEIKSGRSENLDAQTNRKENLNLDCPETEERALDNMSSGNMTNAVQENASAEDKCSVGDTITTETATSPHPKQGSAQGSSGAQMLDESRKDEKQVDKHDDSADRLGMSGDFGPSSVGFVAVSPNVAAADDIKTEAVLQKSITSSEAGRISSDPKGGLGDAGLTHNHHKHVFPLPCQDNKYHSDSSPNLYGDEHRRRRPEGVGTSLYDDSEAIKRKERSKSKRRAKWRNGSRPATATGAFDSRTTDIELEYGILDALEVATKVAKEVAREVDDDREPSGSSSEDLSDGSKQPGSPDSINEKQESFPQSPPKNVPAGENNSTEASNVGQNHEVNSNDQDKEPENGINDMESSQVTEAAQQTGVSAEKGPCAFDLNQEVCSDDTDHAVSSISTPIPVVSASRPAGAPGLPSTPLQFEGTLGWKGSAATSAFRPASPRRISGGVTNISSSKHKQGFLGIDLNVAEEDDDKVEDLTPGKQPPVSSGIKSAESSLEVNPGKSERFKLDLNSTNDDGDAPPSDLRMETRLFFNRNSHQSASPASSSSSMQPPALKSIDLNDRPQFHIDSSDQGPYYGRSSWTPYPCGAPKADEPVISLFGTKVEVNKKDFRPSTSQFLSNGKSLEPTLDLNMARPGGALGLGPAMSFAHSPVYGYNGLTTHPGMPFSSAMYVPGSSIPYMMDTRGAPVMPQVIGSAPPVQPAYSQPPFIMSMAGGPPGLNGAGHVRPSLDLNSGFAVEAASRDPMGLRQFLMPGQGRPVDEQLRANPQPSSSLVIGGKRKEPETGWEPYTINSRPQQPPWR